MLEAVIVVGVAVAAGILIAWMQSKTPEPQSLRDASRAAGIRPWVIYGWVAALVLAVVLIRLWGKV